MVGSQGSRDPNGVDDFGEWEWVIVLGIGLGITGCEEWIFASIGKEYYGSRNFFHDSLSVNNLERDYYLNQTSGMWW
jgi:hypothetical protein